MAIEIPNFYHAAALINPDEAAIVPLIGTVFLSQRGFQPYDPSSDPADPSTVRGGFTYAATGVYWLRTVQAADSLNTIVQVDPKGPQAMWGDYFPQVPEIVGELGDGFTLLVSCVDFEEELANPLGFSINILRYNEEENSNTLFGG